MLEPKADGFRNYVRADQRLSPETLLLERANLLTLTAPEMTVLIGGMRALGANVGQSQHGVFTKRPGTLTNDFFVNLLDNGTEWAACRRRATASTRARDRGGSQVKWTATAVDLVFGSHSQLRAIAEVYASSDAQGEVRPRLRGGLGQGDEPRPLRSAEARLTGVRPHDRYRRSAARIRASARGTSPRRARTRQ